VYLNPKFPTYQIHGAAGNDERHQTGSRNATLSAFFDDEDFGYSRIFVHNSTHFQQQFFHSSDGSLGDEFWIIKTSNSTSGI
jgi:hypothetical protein